MHIHVVTTVFNIPGGVYSRTVVVACVVGSVSIVTTFTMLNV